MHFPDPIELLRLQQEALARGELLVVASDGSVSTIPAGEYEPPQVQDLPLPAPCRGCGGC